MLTVVKGSGSTNNKEKVISKLQLLVEHTRNIENSLAIINNISLTLDWKELNDKVFVCRSDLVQLLKYIKEEHKIYAKHGRKPGLTIVKDDVIEG